jgi:hypothetical protein
MTRARHTPIRSALRRFMLGSGPLKRRSDRLQVLARCAVVLSFLLAPPLAVAAATAATAHLQAVADAEAADRTSVHAVLLEDAPSLPPSSGDAVYTVTSVQTRAVWPAPGGKNRAGIVLVPPRTPAGTAVPVWVDREGNLTRAPLDRGGIPGSANAMAMLVLIAVPVAAVTLYAVLGVALDAYRERRWERAWAAVEPDWHSRLL